MEHLIVKPEILDGRKISFDYVYQRLKAKNSLGDVETYLLQQVALEITNGIRIKKDYYLDKNGVKIIGPGDVKNNAVVISKLKSILPSVLKEKDIVLFGDVLITSAGRSGQIIFVTNELERCAITSDIIKIRPKDRSDSYKIYSFLKSKMGQLQLNSIKRGLVNRIFVEDVGRLEVPKNYKFSDEAISHLSTTKKAIKLYDEAKAIFETYINYNGEDDIAKKLFIIEERALTTDRWDPAYYSYNFTKLIKMISVDIEEIQWISLNELVEIKKTVKPKLDDEQVVKYFVLSDLDADFSVIKGWHEDIYGNLSNRMRYIVQAGEVVTAKAGSATGGQGHLSAVINNEYAGMITSDAFYNMMPVKIDPYYLLFVLKQSIVLKQIEMFTKGTLYKLIQKEDFGRIKIPRLNKQVELNIASKMKNYTDLCGKIVGG